MATETIADRVKLCWPGFKVLEGQTVGELRHWLKEEIRQLEDAIDVLHDPLVVGRDDAAKLTDPVTAG